MRDSNAAQSPLLQHPQGGGNMGETHLRKGVLGSQRSPAAKPPRPTDSIVRSDCHLPAMDSADRRARPVSACVAHFQAPVAVPIER
jgi:hypothetical protein